VEYGAGARRAVVAWKERGLRKLAGWAATVVEATVPRPNAAALVWVPPDPDRRLWRGHHAAEFLARELGAAWELPVTGVLERARGSPRQRGSSRADRRRNVANAFTPTAVVPSRIALVDDVYTTGATAHAAASALRKGGADHVEVVTFARTIRIR
jgi:predicted amidophosphoribosyltransferase